MLISGASGAPRSTTPLELVTGEESRARLERHPLAGLDIPGLGADLVRQPPGDHRPKVDEEACRAITDPGIEQVLAEFTGRSAPDLDRDREDVLATSEDPNGVRFGTYESRLVPGRGDEYNELYLGANYYFYGHRLKLQTGVQWADMNDRANDGGEYSGVAWTTGLRIGW